MSKKPREFVIARAEVRHAIAQYRRRHRQWTTTVMPTMPQAQWDQYLVWVAAFGSHMSKRTRKLSRELTSARHHVRACDPAKTVSLAKAATLALAQGGAHSGRLSGRKLSMTVMNELATVPTSTCARLFIPGKGR